jgi:hypothetical protein
VEALLQAQILAFSSASPESDTAGWVRRVEVSAYVLECSGKAKDTVAALPELQDVVSQLKRTFNYSACGLTQTLFARGTDRTNFQTSSGSTPNYILGGHIELDGDDTSPIVRIQQLDIRTDTNQFHFSASPELRAGRRVVVGKLGAVTGEDALLVLTAKVVD